MTGDFSDPEVRIEGHDKVTGAAAYAADFHHVDALDVAFVRSPFPYARIASIDTDAATSMPGVRAVVTGADLAGVRLGRRLQDWPALAGAHALMVGDRVAAVAAESKVEAENAVRAVVVEYEELEPLLDMDRALDPGSPLLHPHADGYRYLGGERPVRSHPNVQGERLTGHGDVESAFSQATHVFEHTFAVPKGFTGYLEPRAAMAWTEGEVLHLLTTNKSPFRLRDQMAAALGVAEDSIVVHTGVIGGDFGGKGLSIDEYVLGHLARVTGRTVRTVTGFADDVSTTTSRHAASLRLRTAVADDGTFLAHEATALIDGGAYAAGKPNPELVPAKAHVTLSGYRVPAARLDVTCVYTNTLPGSNARSPGQPQSAFAGESHIDLIALALDIDPLELRLRNAIGDGEVDVAGSTWRRSTMTASLEALSVEMVRHAPRDGFSRGIAAGSRAVASGDASVRLSVASDGHIDVVTGVTDQGGGAYTMLQRVVAGELGVERDRILVRGTDTAQALWDKGVGGSRVTPVVGGAAHAGAAQLRARLDEMAPDRPIDEQLAACAGIEVVGGLQSSIGDP